MRTPSSRPASPGPFAAWPGGRSFGEGRGRTWFSPDGVLCVQLLAARVDLPLAKAYMGAIRSIRDAERDAIAEAGGLRIYQDFRALRLIDRDARDYLVDAARADFGRWSLVSNTIELAPRNLIVRTAIQLIARIVTQMGMPSLHITEDLGRELARDGIRVPLPPHVGC